jgi:uncharacterized protein (TIGR01777 family)
LTEDSPPGTDFLASVCKDWEAAAAPAARLNVRLSTIRIGLVLARGEGALGVMTPIFRYLPGGAAAIGNQGRSLMPATGRQWVSWIHVDDLVELFLFALDRPDASGVFNGTTPNPVRNAEFGRALAHTLWRPFLPIGPPDGLLKLLLGEVADVITKGQRVVPTKAQTMGFPFAYPELKLALREIFTKAPRVAPSAP